VDIPLKLGRFDGEIFFIGASFSRYLIGNSKLTVSLWLELAPSSSIMIMSRGSTNNGVYDSLDSWEKIVSSKYDGLWTGLCWEFDSELGYQLIISSIYMSFIERIKLCLHGRRKFWCRFKSRITPMTSLNMNYFPWSSSWWISTCKLVITSGGPYCSMCSCSWISSHIHAPKFF